MDCEDNRALLHSYAEGDLDRSSASLVSAHLEKCSRCREELAGITGAWEALSAWEDREPPPRLHGKILSAARRERTVRRLRLILPAAAVLLLVIGAALFSGVGREHPGPDFADRITQTDSPPETEATIPGDEDIIANLHLLLKDRDFLESLDELEKIDYLPLLDDAQGGADRDRRSGLDWRVS